MRVSASVAVVTVFTALIVSSDFGLAPYYNVKLMDTLVFVAAFVFGLRVGSVVAVLSETIWGFVSPIGMAGAILPFLVAGELLFSFSGYAAARVWGASRIPALSSQNLFFGAILTICAFLWDFETNIATGLIAGASTLSSALSYEIPGIPFMITHELSDFYLGALMAPAIIAYSWRLAGGRGLLNIAERTGPTRNRGEE